MNGYWNHTTTTLWRASLLAALLIVLQGIALAAPAAGEECPFPIGGIIRYDIADGSCQPGTISGGGYQSGIPGELGSPVTAVPNGGWEFVEWSDGNTNPTRSDTIPCFTEDDSEFEARFVLNVRYIAGTGGTISGETSQRLGCFEYGTEVIAVPSSGYSFVRWSDTSPTLDPNAARRTDTPRNLPASGEVTALFFQGDRVNLTYTAGPGGRILGDTSQQVTTFSTGTAVIAEPDEGYRFKEWSDGSTSPGRQDTVADSDLAFTATFVRVFRIRYEAGEGGTISGDTDQYVELGEDGTSVMAVPDVGWKFLIWSDGVETPIRVETEVTSNNNAVAIFAPIFDGEGLQQVTLSPRGKDGNRSIKIVRPDGVQVSMRLGPNNQVRANIFTLPAETVNPSFSGKIKAIIRKAVGPPPSDKNAYWIKTKTVGGVRGKNVDDCTDVIVPDFSEWEYLVDDGRITGTLTDELSIDRPFIEEDSGAYFQLYFNEGTQEWERTVEFIFDVGEVPLLDDADCDRPLPSLVSAYGNPAFQSAAALSLTPIMTADLDGLLRGESNIYDYWEVALLEHLVFGNMPHPWQADVSAVYAFNFDLLFEEEPAMLSLLEAAGALPFAAATLAISSEWQAAWAELGLTQDYELVQLPGGKSGNNEPLSPGGDLNNDGLTNQQAFDQVVQNGGNVFDYILLADGFGIEPEPANMPVGGAGAALLLLGLGGIAALARRRR